MSRITPSLIHIIETETIVHQVSNVTYSRTHPTAMLGISTLAELLVNETSTTAAPDALHPPTNPAQPVVQPATDDGPSSQYGQSVVANDDFDGVGVARKGKAVADPEEELQHKEDRVMLENLLDHLVPPVFFTALREDVPTLRLSPEAQALLTITYNIKQGNHILPVIHSLAREVFLSLP